MVSQGVARWRDQVLIPAAMPSDGAYQLVLRSEKLMLGGDTPGLNAIDADVVEGAAVEPLIARLLANAEVSYIHAHYAKRGCYSGRIDRA